MNFNICFRDLSEFTRKLVVETGQCVFEFLFHLSNLFARRPFNNYREVKHDVNGRRQTAKVTSDFEFSSFNP